ncbi:palmitoyl protein thioesterase [Guillardia theta CCMP2712]|uniref:Palmitoyl-protein thioesterase 1 n=1 Tax=Guillardia theta (strain CCMP2712) TaxID=905079 RepID=L1JS62_GUITC|nr:palmitoyl protein thioesterase [Guillardia theta CCMP2712]EKX51030.1 palmitoyl protein thioesterase [Guillardia theta CCMP2712]|eukprot:XP_005838010.1 palmitoyl protein thioesterase [Guillardia theta CCMP2712]
MLPPLRCPQVAFHAVLLAMFLASSAAIPLPARSSNTSRAVVMWHGMGDTCCLPVSMGRVKSLIEKHVPGAYVRSLMIGENEAKDQYNGFFMPIHEQLTFACNLVSKDPNLAGGFHAVGFSQGGLFLRALVQTCPEAKVQSLISIGGPQQGVYGLPRCITHSVFCETMKKLLEMGAYESFVQQRSVQAQYWQDPVKSEEYLKYNIFLPDINNNLEEKKAVYRDRILSLNKLVLVKFQNDTVVVPRESTWFEFYQEGQDVEIQDLKQSKLYEEDWIGLKSLDAAGKVCMSLAWLTLM